MSRCLFPGCTTPHLPHPIPVRQTWSFVVYDDIKEESAMPKQLKVSVGTVDEVRLVPGENGVVDALVLVRVDGVGEGSEVVWSPGKTVVVARYVSDLFAITGPGREVIEAAKGVVARWNALLAIGGLVSLEAENKRLVEAMRAVEGK